MTTYDAIIIGTGQAGPALARRLAGTGMKVAIIERGRFGGTCVNTGCTPTKTLVASAYAVHMARRGADYGFSVGGEITVDMKRVKARKDYVAGLSNKGVERSLKKLENGTVYEGHARFRSPHEVEVGGAVLGADKIFINVGGRAAVPDIPGLDQIDYLTNSSMMDVDFLPRHLLVLGGSYIGLEFGQMYRRFGSDVTIVEVGPRLIPREDEDVSEAVAAFLGREGVAIRTSAKCLSLSRRDGEIVMALDCDEGAREVRGSHLLVATGRRPNTDDLGLDRAGVKVDQRGYIEVDDELRTSAPGIWALGDCNGRGAFTHTSWNDFEIVAANLLDGDQRRLSDRIPAYALYTDPPLGRAGMSEAEVRRSGRRALIARTAMEDVSRAFEKGETEGFMKVLVDADSRQILGAAFLGTSGDEAIHCVLDTMYAKAPYTVLQRAVHIHPTIAEFIPTILGDLAPLS
ncbi:FAD-containing oxidoreductase [Vineibacter terrae]|uniref:FAD-containing oxidoreductase n=1 Tax=Vineibacter terrae TaxID=2586908 RepID=UPI002E357F2C|nr:FAD-containing oxidoreductase [Vineibacter terrae]HEX2886831.1 FAD-containing oxidoreductase [Vineibacter terrae]